MNDIEVSSIDLVEGGNVFKQGHYLTLGYVPRDEKGETVDLSGKTLNVSLWGRKGVVFEAAATYSGGVIRFTFDKLVAAGDYTVEFTATSSTDSKYRKKFPTNQHSGRIAIKQSADDLGVVGIQVYTVAQLKAEQKALLDVAVSGFTVDSETKMARVSGTTTHPTIGARLEADKQVLTQQLADKASKAELQAVASGAPKPYANLAAIQAAFPSGDDNHYLNVADGNWYYWNDSAWVVGGEYLSGGYFNYSDPSVNVFDKTTVTSGGYYSATSPYNWVANANISQSAPIPLVTGSIVRFKSGVNGAYQLVYRNEAGVIIAGNAQSVTANTVYSLTAPANAVSVSSAVYNSTLNSFMITINNEMPETYVPFSTGEVIGVNSELKSAIQQTVNEGGVVAGNYEGKYLSILGDSISTYPGYIPEGNLTFYSGSNHGVTSVNQMWWKRLMDQTGLQLCVNNAWSGSKVTGTAASSASMARATALHTTTQNPDVIIVYIGINDFNAEAAMGVYDGSQAFPTSTATFREAYAIMLSKIQTQYSLAEIYVCTLPDCERNGSLEFPETNDSGLLLNSFNKAIEELADLFSVNVLRMDKSGLTFYNKSVYLSDELHPNANGQKLLGNKAIKTIAPSSKYSY